MERKKIIKIFISAILSVVAAIFASTLIVFAASLYTTNFWSNYYSSDHYDTPVYTSGIYDYILNGQNATIIDCENGTVGNIVIPSKIDGYTVTGIYSRAFKWCDKITGITIPNSVVSIGSNAFASCNSLKEITIPDSITKIESCTFYNCTSLTTVKIGTGVSKIATDAFMYCDKFQNIIVSDKNINFSSDDGILFDKNKTVLYLYPSSKTYKKYSVPNSVSTIKSHAFENCNTLTEVVVSNNVTSIENGAFYRCESIAKITLPFIGGSSNEEDDVCDCLGHIFSNYSYCNRYDHCYNGYVPKSLKEVIISDGCSWIGNYAFNGCSTITSIKIPDSVTKVGDYAFTECTWYENLTGEMIYVGKVLYDYRGSGSGAITIKDGTVGIAPGVFNECSSMTSITIPGSVKAIGNGAFSGCNSLLNVYYKGDVAGWCGITMGYGNGNYWYSSTTPLYYASAFYIGGIKVTDLSIPSSVTKINPGVFQYCKSITSVYIPDSVKEIGNNAFSYCNNITSVSIGNGVTDIKENAFYYCGSLKKLKLGNKIERIEAYAFSECSFEKIILPDTVSYIGSGTFAWCYNLTSLNIPLGITKIESSTFEYCRYLDNLVLPESVTEIGSRAFSGCYGTITIPNSVKVISYDAFSDNSYGCVIKCPQGSYADEFAQNHNITVEYINKVVNIHILRLPEQTVYAMGSELITTGLTLYITTDDGNTKKVTTGFEIGEYNFSTAGEKIITVTYGEASTKFKVKVDASLEPYPQSLHPYENNSDISWKYTHPSAAKQIVITFSSETTVEGGCDFIYIYDGNGNLVGKYTGNDLAGSNIAVNGNSFKIRLTSDESFSKYGFSIVSIQQKVEGINEGDVNGDGLLNSLDLIEMRKIILNEDIADVNRDGKTDIRDLVRLKNILSF